MRIIAMSDSHGDFARVRRIFEENPGADLFLHLGDGAGDFEEAGWLFPDVPRKGVRGNCDFGHDWDLPREGMLEFAGKQIYFTHGDRWQVKSGLDEIERAGRERGADVVLFGHTHRAMAEYRDGLWLINPGSVRFSGHTQAGYLALDITPAGIVPVLRSF